MSGAVIGARPSTSSRKRRVGWPRSGEFLYLRLGVAVVVLTGIVSLAVGLNGGSGATYPPVRTATLATASSKLGRILVDGQRRTHYLFEKDKRRRSACYGMCAAYWPPYSFAGS